MQKLYKIFFILLSFNIHSQEDEKVDINVERVNTIQELLNQVQVNKSIYKNDDSKRIAEFLELVDERQLILNKTKTDLKNEQARNTRLELSFEKNDRSNCFGKV